MGTEKDTTDYLIQELKKINLPFPRITMREDQIEDVFIQLDEIEQTLSAYRKHMKTFKISKRQDLP